MAEKKYDLVIIGGGIIGLATAMRISDEFPGLKVAVLEKEGEVATHQTGHNSGVIHAGIYYAPGSQKANFCSTGGKLLRDFCDQHDIEYEMCGKLIVAINDDEVPRLEELFRRGTENGAEGLRMVDRDEINEIEPHSAGIRAIFSPNTGIIDYKKVSEAYATQFGENGGDLITGGKVNSISRRDGLIHLETDVGEISAVNIINCAGLQADEVARMMGVDIGVRIIPFRGEYFSIVPEKAHMVKGLIYPVPDPNLPFLGVHFTRRVNGSVEAGPNAVFSFAKEGYSKTNINFKTGIALLKKEMKNPAYIAIFAPHAALISEYAGKPGAGVRAQAVDKKGQLLQDFSIAETENAIHVINAPSPGATSSLSISRYIVDMANKSFGLSST